MKKLLRKIKIWFYESEFDYWTIEHHWADTEAEKEECNKMMLRYHHRIEALEKSK